MSENETARLLNDARQMKEELLALPSPRVYSDDTSPVRFSLIPLQHLSEFEFQKYETVSEAIQAFRSQLRHQKTILREKEEILKVLKSELSRIERSLQRITVEAENSNRADQYERFGKLLISHLHLIKKGDSTALVENFIDRSNDLIEIQLDTHLNPAKNAERYFEKAVKSRRAAEEQRQRVIELADKRNSASQTSFTDGRSCNRR